MNVINKLHILKSTVSIAREKFRESLWRNTFQAIEDRMINTDDPKKINAAHDFLSKYWQEIHNSGIELQRILKIMDPLDVLYQFEEL